MRTLSRWFWAIAGVVPIRVKILGIVIGVTLVLGIAVSVLMHRGLSTTLEQELEQRGIAIAVNLANRSEDLILTDRLFALYRLCKETVRDNRNVEYVFITDPRGDVLIHTFQGGMPADLLTLPIASPNEASRVQLVQTERGAIRTISAPVLASRLGTVHVGMSQHELEANVARYIWRILVTTTAIVVVGTIAAFGMTTILTRPLTQLAQAAEDIGRGDFTWRAPRWARDEIGRLGASFARMAERLEALRCELRRRDEIRTRLLDQVMTAQEEERRRIARELHDDTGQALTSLIVGLAMIGEATDVDQARAQAAALSRQASRTLEEVHNLSRGLRPSVLDDLGLLPAVERHLKEYTVSHGVAVDFHAAGFDGERLPAPVEIAIYRIMQEALTNTAKHANATTVSVLLERGAESVRLIVEDDGRGFDIDTVVSREHAERLGLHGMRERATLLGGTVTIEATPGHGATVFAEIPLEARS